MEKQLKALEKQFQKNDKERQVFNGVHYPKEFPTYRVMTDGRMLLISDWIVEAVTFSLFGSGVINHYKADKIGATDKIDGNFPDWMRVIPQKIENQFEITIPEWFKNIKGKSDLFLDFETGNISLIPLNGNSVALAGDRLAWLAGSTVSIGYESLETIGSKPIAIWEAGKSYNPTVNRFTFILMPLKVKDSDIEFSLKKVEIVSNVLETV